MSEKIKTKEVEGRYAHPKHEVLERALQMVDALANATKRQRLFLASALSMVFACTPPEPPDDGHISQQKMRYALGTDYELEIIIGRLLDWLETEGQDLLDTEVTSNNYEEFLIPALRPDDVVYYNRLTHGGALEDATGAITTQTLSCTWEQLEEILTAPNQADVSPGWDSYQRSFETDEGQYENGRETLDFPETPNDLPEDLLAQDVSDNDLDGAMLVTLNVVDPAWAFGVDIPNYEMGMSFRHGRISDEGETGARHFALVRAFNPNVALEPSGSGLGQSYSIAIYIGNPDGTTTRVASVWSETLIGGETTDGEIILLNKARAGREMGLDLEAACQD